MDSVNRSPSEDHDPVTSSVPSRKGMVISTGQNLSTASDSTGSGQLVGQAIDRRRVALDSLLQLAHDFVIVADDFL